MTDEYIELGIEQLDQNNPEKALQYFQAAYALQPDNDVVLFYLGLTHHRLKHLEEAVHYYRQSLAVEPESAETWLNLGNCLDEMKQLDDAEEAYRMASILNPEDDEVYIEWGIFYYNQYRWEEALACFEQAHRLNPNNEGALWQQGDTLIKMEKTEEALEVAETLTHRNPKNWKAWSNYAWCCLQLGLYEQLITAARKIIRLCPDNPDGYEMLGDALLETGHPEKALPQYEKVIKLDPDYLSALGSKGYCLLLLERYEEALRCYEVVTREVDDDHEFWNCMGVTLHHLQRDDEALDCYQKALDLKPDYLLALRNMADVYLKYKQCDTAEELYLKAYRIGNRPADLFAATLCMYMTHRYEEMVQPLLSLLPVAKEEGLSVAYRLAVAYKNLHQYEEAIRYYKLQMETSQDGSDNSACWFQLALCEKKLKHLDEAENSMKKALELGLTPIVVVNKIDRDGCNPHGALDKVFDLFCELDANEEQLDFDKVFGSGRKGICKAEMEDPDGDFSILMDKIIERIPAPKGDPAAEPLLQIASLEYSTFLGRLAVGRVQQGVLKPNQTYAQSFTDGTVKTIRPQKILRYETYAQSFTDGTVKTIRPQKILRYEGLTPKPVDEAGPGEIVLIAGLDTFDIGDTISATSNPKHLPRIHIDPPTISMIFTVNTSPLAGKYGGKFMTGNQLQERLERAHMADPALLVEKVDGASTFKVSGRGILHLTILVENMRRELYEFTIGSPQVIFHNDENGKLLEPVEDFKVEVPNEFSGACIQEIQQRKGEMVNMVTDDNDRVTLEFIVPSRGLIGIRPRLLSLSKGYAVTQSFFKEYQPYKGEIPTRINGVLIAKEPGEAASYALSNLEDRGYLVIGPGAEVYPGMIVGEHNRDVDIIVNVTKGKHLTNMRSKSADDMIQLTPYRRMTLTCAPSPLTT